MKLISGSKVLTHQGDTGEVDEGISLGVERPFAAGSIVRLEEPELEAIATTLTLIVGPELARVAQERIALR
jgi:hypothetical protein